MELERRWPATAFQRPTSTSLTGDRRRPSLVATLSWRRKRMGQASPSGRPPSSEFAGAYRAPQLVKELPLLPALVHGLRVLPLNESIFSHPLIGFSLVGFSAFRLRLFAEMNTSEGKKSLFSSEITRIDCRCAFATSSAPLSCAVVASH